jgi:hypothetical protein
MLSKFGLTGIAKLFDATKLIPLTIRITALSMTIKNQQNVTSRGFGIAQLLANFEYSARLVYFY